MQKVLMEFNTTLRYFENDLMYIEIKCKYNIFYFINDLQGAKYTKLATNETVSAHVFVAAQTIIIINLLKQPKIPNR